MTDDDNQPDGLGDVEEFEGHDLPFDDADDSLDAPDGDVKVLTFEDED